MKEGAKKVCQVIVNNISVNILGKCGNIVW
jgi:hypothetical protein